MVYDNAGGTGRRWLVTAGVAGFVASQRVRSHPHRMYRALRMLDSVHESPTGVWILSAHAEVSAALRHPDLGNDETKADLTAIRLGPFQRLLAGGAGQSHLEGRQRDPGPTLRSLRQLMLFRDPPDHTRLRSLVNKAFTPRAVAALEERIAKIAHQRLDRVVRRGGMDLMSEFAYPLPALVICELMGVPSSDHELIARHAPALAARLDPAPMRNASVLAAADRATVALTDYLNGVISERRRDPGDDILSRLLDAEDDGDRLNHDELVAMALLLLIAGHETTANLIGNGTLALLSHPDQWQRFKGDEKLDRSTVEEVLRFDGPIQMVERTALTDVELGSARIPKGRITVLCIAAANRDPAVFTQPNRLDVGRDPNPHLGFGGGAHFCVGAPLARLEARVALRALAERLPGVVTATKSPRWRPSFTIRGLRELPLSWDSIVTPRQAAGA